MRVTITCSEWLKRFTGGAGEMEMDLEPGATALEAALAVGIPAGEIGFLVVNQEKADEKYPLKDGDRMKVYPLIIGG